MLMLRQVGAAAAGSSKPVTPQDNLTRVVSQTVTLIFPKGQIAGKIPRVESELQALKQKCGDNGLAAIVDPTTSQVLFTDRSKLAGLDIPTITDLNTVVLNSENWPVVSGTAGKATPSASTPTASATTPTPQNLAAAGTAMQVMGATLKSGGNTQPVPSTQYNILTRDGRSAISDAVRGPIVFEVHTSAKEGLQKVAENIFIPKSQVSDFNSLRSQYPNATLLPSDAKGSIVVGSSTQSPISTSTSALPSKTETETESKKEIGELRATKRELISYFGRASISLGPITTSPDERAIYGKRTPEGKLIPASDEEVYSGRTEDLINGKKEIIDRLLSNRKGEDAILPKDRMAFVQNIINKGARLKEVDVALAKLEDVSTKLGETSFTLMTAKKAPNGTLETTRTLVKEAFRPTDLKTFEGMKDLCKKPQPGGGNPYSVAVMTEDGKVAFVPSSIVEGKDYINVLKKDQLDRVVLGEDGPIYTAPLFLNEAIRDSVSEKEKIAQSSVKPEPGIVTGAAASSDPAPEITKIQNVKIKFSYKTPDGQVHKAETSVRVNLTLRTQPSISIDPKGKKSSDDFEVKVGTYTGYTNFNSLKNVNANRDQAMAEKMAACGHPNAQIVEYPEDIFVKLGVPNLK